MTLAIAEIELRVRARAVIFAAAGLICLTAAVGALFPSLGGSIGHLNLSKSVSGLIGGSDFSTITGWLRAEITSIYGPLVFSGIAITAATSTTAGEEEDRILPLVLAQPVSRERLLLAKACAIALLLLALGAAVFVGLVLAVALAGGGVSLGHLAATALNLLFLSLAVGALALALAAATGRRGTAAGVAATITLVMFLVNGIAPALSGVGWLKYLTFFYYYEGHNPLTEGVYLPGLAVLAALAIALTAAAVAGFAHRDLRG
jgi:ABC-2 type transport system permease protein